MLSIMLRCPRMELVHGLQRQVILHPFSSKAAWSIQGSYIASEAICRMARLMPSILPLCLPTELVHGRSLPTIQRPFPTTKVPTDFYLGRTCLVDSGFVYCIGYFASAADAVYFAPLSSGGVGVWSATTNYPTPIVGQSCVADSGFAYCIGGTTSALCNCATSAVYFARFVTEGVTRTSVSCTPSSIAYNQPGRCTATVTDSSASPTSPSGTATFSINTITQGYFTPSNTCPLVSTGPSTASCAVNVTYPAPNPCCIPPSEGSQPVPGT